MTAIAGSFEEGNGLVEAGGYDILLGDLGLPGGSGIALIGRETATGRDTDTLVITVFGEQAKVLDCIRAGARRYGDHLKAWFRQAAAHTAAASYMIGYLDREAKDSRRYQYCPTL